MVINIAMNTKNIVEGLTANDSNVQFEAVQNLKSFFKPPDKIFSKLKLESLLQGARISLENKTPDLEFLYSYGTALVGFIGKSDTINSEILHQVEFILGKLNDERLKNELITGLWSQLEKNSKRHPDGILDSWKPTLERTALEWVVNGPDSRMAFLSRTSADSPKCFQSLTSILYEILMKTHGHVRVFDVTSSFIEAVKRECQNSGKCFLRLYPKDCRRLVSLMKCPPELGSDVVKEVMVLLSEMFFMDRSKALILLSHFTRYMRFFKTHLEKNEIYN